MPEALSLALQTEGLMWLIAGATLAGLVRGFSGFGTAMVYLPFAAQVIGPFEALTTLLIMDLIGPLPNLPRAWRDGHPRDVARLGIGMILALPFGVYALSLVAPEVFRYGVSVVTFVLLALLLAGVRYRGQLTKGMIYLTGACGGFLAGCVGLAGPPVILLYMASPHGPAVVRANNLVFLFLADVLMLIVLWAFGHLVPSAIWIGLVIAVPYLLANIAGAAIFNPERERSYRTLAYIIIVASAFSGLPIWD